MGPSRADARSGAADNVKGYRGSGSKQEKERGDIIQNSACRKIWMNSKHYISVPQNQTVAH
uniref:SFRICE_005049 n=1 Tax=Spodoptera frugiperda TaxID=7108 RepID=A0A2H1VS86_SPOFR